MCTILCMYEGEAETTEKTETEADRLTSGERIDVVSYCG